MANGRYLASDKWFVNWGNSPKEKQLLGETHFICNKTKGYAEKFAQSKKMDLIYFSENKSGSSIAVLKKGE